MALRVGIVTTWGSSCGIATYSEQLGDALRREQVYVVALAPNEGGSCLSIRSELPVELCWTRRGHGMAEGIVHVAKQHELDVVHFQHEHGLFWDSHAFLMAISACKRIGIKTVVTFHTIKPSGGYEDTGLYSGTRQLANLIVAHTVQGQASLSVVRGSARVQHVPHGSIAVHGERGSRQSGQEVVQMPAHMRKIPTWCLVIGFQSPNKNIVCTIRAFSEAMARGQLKDCGLLIVGSTGTDETYATSNIPSIISSTGYQRFIHQHVGFIKPEHLSDVMALGDFGVLNTTSSVLSASGQVHIYASFAVPLAVADRPIYNEAIIAGAVPYQLNTDFYFPGLSQVNAISALGSSREMRSEVGNKMFKFSQNTRWDKLAILYKGLYQEI